MATKTSMDCPGCGAAMRLDSELTILVCPYCGNTEPLDKVTLERLTNLDQKEIELERIKLEKERQALDAQERREEAERREKSRRAQARHDIASSTARKIKRVIIGVVAVLVALCAIVVVCETIDDNNYKREREQRLNSEYTWPTTGLALLIDKPASDRGYISTNSLDRFEIDVKCESVNEFNEYIQSAIARGFTIDAASSTSSYKAYDESGNLLDIYFYNSSNQLNIELRAARKNNTIVWPTSGVGALVPTPESLVGEVESQSLDSFRIFVCKTDLAAFNEYIDRCVEAGFTENASRSADYYSADNGQGAHISISYEGFNTMKVSLYEKSS